jgi:hypothetical protein
VRASLHCSDPLEFEYFHRNAKFPRCCSICGDRGNDLTVDAAAQRLYRDVLPACALCNRLGKSAPRRYNTKFRELQHRNAERPETDADNACERDGGTSSGPAHRPSSGAQQRTCSNDDTDVDEDADLGTSDSSDEEDGEAAEELGEDEYIIEEIIELHPTRKPMHWLVKWAGYPLDRELASSWVKRTAFSTEGSHQMLLEFERQRKQGIEVEAAAKRKAKRNAHEQRRRQRQKMRYQEAAGSSSADQDSNSDLDAPAESVGVASSNSGMPAAAAPSAPVDNGARKQKASASAPPADIGSASEQTTAKAALVQLTTEWERSHDIEYDQPPHSFVMYHLRYVSKSQTESVSTLHKLLMDEDSRLYRQYASRTNFDSLCQMLVRAGKISINEDGKAVLCYDPDEESCSPSDMDESDEDGAIMADRRAAPALTGQPLSVQQLLQDSQETAATQE